MAWTIPDKGEGANDIQSILFQEYLEVLAAGSSDTDFVSAGCAVTAQGSPNMTVAVADGLVVSNGQALTVAAGNVTVTTADGSNPRLDLIVADSTGAKQIRTGTAAAAPKPPARSANDVVLAVVYVPASDTTIATNQITDLRMLAPFKPFSVRLTADDGNATTTVAEVAGLTIRVEPGTYDFEYVVRAQSGTATTSLKFAVTHTGTVTSFMYWLLWPSGGVTAATGVIDQELNATTGNVFAVMATRAKNTTLGPMTDVDTINADIMFSIKGKMVVTVAGNLQLFHASETANTTTVMTGSSLHIKRVA